MSHSGVVCTVRARMKGRQHAGVWLPLGDLLRTLSGSAIGLLVHQALIVLMVVRRLFLLTTERARSTSPGADL